MKTESILIQVADGTEMLAQVSKPARTGKGPAILILQEAFGVNHHIIELTKRFAEIGYVALAPELYHRSAPRGFVADYTDFDQVKPHLQAIKTESLAMDLEAAFHYLTADALVDEKKISSVGYCMGGRASFVANSRLPLCAAVSYYGGGIAPDLLSLAKTQHAPILFFWGEADTHIPKDQRRAVIDAMEKAKKKFVEVVFSEAGHGFFCDERPSYHAESAKLSWDLMHSFLGSHKDPARK